MYFGEDHSEELNVVGTPAFMEFVESIKSEGVILRKKVNGLKVQTHRDRPSLRLIKKKLMS